MASHPARAALTSVLHQSTTLHVAWGATRNGSNSNYTNNGWHLEGSTDLYLINHNPPDPSGGEGGGGNDATVLAGQLALHLRSSCHVVSIRAHGIQGTRLASLACESVHTDPLRHVLLRPAGTVGLLELDNDDGGGGGGENNNNNNNNIKTNAGNTTKQQHPSPHYRLDADSQSSRGAAGMTTALRAAAMASNLGELRIRYEVPPPSGKDGGPTTTTSGVNGAPSPSNNNTAATASTKLAELLWKRDLESLPDRIAHHRTRRRDRFDRVAQLLAQAGLNAALKITIRYEIDLKSNDGGGGNGASSSHYYHLGGLHLVGGPNPHVYTTPGSFGDGEGPRCWVPCLDSAATAHRSTHQLCICLTAGVRHGLTAVASGDDVGRSQSYMHWSVAPPSIVSLPSLAPPPEGEPNPDIEDRHTVPTDGDDDQPVPAWNTTTTTDAAVARAVLADEHVDFLLRLAALPPQPQPQPHSGTVSTTTTSAHIIPHDAGAPVHASTSATAPFPTLDAVQATVRYQTACWSPAPVRSIGWAVGPFAVTEDAEYFAGVEDEDDGEGDAEDDDIEGNRMDDGDANDEDEDDDAVMEDATGSRSRRSRPLQRARRNGHGIRQYYFCPVYERKFVHLNTADRTLLPSVDLRVVPLTARQRDLSDQLKAAVQASTVGVPLRALSLVRDVLALPTFRTWSHTQVWIPDCHNGGVTCGSLHSCPEVSLNAFLGFSVLDSRLLPPPGSRLPYAAGGRALQFAQARAAIRGWIWAAVPLGGNDDVSNGYVHSVAESLLVSLYERGHGAHGEGKMYLRDVQAPLWS